jgi:ribosome assembly protein RRB1
MSKRSATELEKNDGQAYLKASGGGVKRENAGNDEMGEFEDAWEDEIESDEDAVDAEADGGEDGMFVETSYTFRNI